MDFNDRLLQAIKTDNLKDFNSCMETTNCGPLRLGRFPVLSALYLYNSRRILRAYEKAFVKLNSWKDVGEPPELSGKLRAVAGKCLRIYLNEIVTPIEMLLLLDDNAKVKRLYQVSHVAPPVKQRLKDIYYVKWGLSAEFVRNTIVLERRPLTYAEKKRWLLRSVCALLCVAIIVSSPFVVNAFSPFITDTEGVLNVVSWSQIRFSSNKTYALKNDVTVPSNFFAEKMNCTLDGNGHTVTVLGDGLFGELNGKLQNITFETNGSPVVQTVSRELKTIEIDGQQYYTPKVKAENITVNATVNLTTDKPIGFFANRNCGAITNVVVNVSGTLTATESDENADKTPSFNCGGIVAKNKETDEDKCYSQLTDCSANYDDFKLKGVWEANAVFGGIVGENGGNVANCQTSGSITADTFDVAGICAENARLIGDCENKANLTQTTDSDEWYPNVSGIVILNTHIVNYCTNSGTITSISNAVVTDNNAEKDPLCAHAAGIANASYGLIHHCYNTGSIVAQSLNDAIVGGIVGTNCWQTVVCQSTGSITVTGKVCFVGGIAGNVIGDLHNNFGVLSDCIASCQIEVTSSGIGSFAAVGGIVGYANERPSTHNGGEMKYCYFTGTLTAFAGAYVGGIAGVVGENVYNTFVAGVKNDANGKEQTYFYVNVYSSGCGVLKAFGAAYTQNNTYKSVSDIGTQRATKEAIESSQGYQEVLELLQQI